MSQTKSGLIFIVLPIICLISLLLFCIPLLQDFNHVDASLPVCWFNSFPSCNCNLSILTFCFPAYRVFLLNVVEFRWFKRGCVYFWGPSSTTIWKSALSPNLKPQPNLTSVPEIKLSLFYNNHIIVPFYPFLL